jgi:hypothetical protein
MKKLNAGLYAIVLGLTLNLLANMIWRYLPSSSWRIDWLVSSGLIGICLILILLRRSSDNDGEADSEGSYESGQQQSQRNVYLRSVRSNGSVNVETVHGDKIVVTGMSHESETPLTRPVPSLSFTVGYLNAKANWIAMNAINVFCLNKSGAKHEFFAKYLLSSELDLTLLELSRAASRAGWPSLSTMENITTINSSEWLGNAVQLIFAKAPTEGFRNKELEALVATIESLSKEVFLDAARAKADVGMVFLGNQIGKVDALLVLGMRAGDSELDKLVPICRPFIKAIFLAHLAPGNQLQEQLSWIIADNPGLSSKVDSMTSSELAVFVGRAKDAYLIVSK